MDFYADVGCLLKVSVNCDACKMKVHEVLRGVQGVYSVEIDSDEGLAKISGEMDPNVVLATLASTGTHAEVKWMKISSPAPRARGGYYHNGGSIRAGHRNSYRSRPALHDNSSWYDSHHNYYPQRTTTTLDYPYNYGTNYGGYQDASYSYPSYDGYKRYYSNSSYY